MQLLVFFFLLHLPSAQVETFQPQPTITIAAVGDIMLGTNYPSKEYLPADAPMLLAPARKHLQGASLTVGNLEGTLCDEQGEVKRCSNPKVCYAFRSPERYSDVLAAAGFDFVSMANNHSGDFGATGRKRTTTALQRADIGYAGLLEHPYIVKDIDGVRYGFAAFSPNSGTCRITDIDKAVTIVQLLDSITDIVVVSFHGGAEGRSYTHVPKKTEMFLGENRGDVHKFAHSVIDAGADIVYGHGPHVPRAIELYKNRLISYSLGNFATYGRFSLSGVSGYAPLLLATLNKDGSFISGKIISYQQLGEGGLTVDETGKAATLIAELTQQDFPYTRLSIGEEGNISVTP